MNKQYIQVGNNNWDVFIYFVVNESNIYEIIDILQAYGCPNEDIEYSLSIVYNLFNTGMTFTNTELRTSIVCIGKVSSGNLFLNTVVHEAKHVLSHICSYYLVKEDGEKAAYLIGWLVQQMYGALKKYGRF